jgi:hypothetical protein
MRVFLLFLYGKFNTHEDVATFCLDILGANPLIAKIRFIIEDNTKSLIVIFETDLDRKTLSEELHKVLTDDIIKFYFLFERDSIHTANLPVQMREFIFKPHDNFTSLRLEYDEPEKTTEQQKMNLDLILEKIEQFGIESLLPDEKKFLDNFEM